MITSTRYATPKVQRKSYRDWMKGTVTAYDDGRTPSDGLRGSGNQVLDQDGTLRPRPSLVRYGTQPTGTILGETFEYVKTLASGSENYLLNLQNVAGTTNIYTSKDGGAWTLASGKTFDNTASGHFCQVDDKVLIMNGTDNLSYFDIPTAAVIPYTALSTPSAPTLTTLTGLTGTTLNYYYQITANSTVGETAASSSLVQPVLIDRDTWVPATNSVKISWSAVTSATSYNVYLGLVATGPFYLISAGVNGLSFLDDGTTARDTTRPAPLVDSTAGPKATRGTVINGQVFLTGISDRRRSVLIGGFGDHVLDFSPVNGGFEAKMGRGTKEFPVRVMPFRDGRGNATIAVLCSGTNGRGKRYNLSPNTLDAGNGQIIDFFDIVEDNGQDGTDSPDGVILYNDSLWYPSRDGFKTTGTKPQLQNILSTNRVSNTIQGDIKNLNNSSMSNCVGLGFEGKLYWALPSGSTTNNEIWVLDLDREGAWMKPWSISASWLTLYNDNSGTTHFLVYSNNIQYELTYAQASNDDGVAFATNATSGLNKFSDDGLDWAKVIDVTFELLRPQGEINLGVAGKTEDASLASVGSSTFSANSTVAGWSEAGWSSFGWSDTPLVPTHYGDASTYVVIEVDEELQYWSWSLDTGTVGTDYQISDVIIRFVIIGTKSNV